MNAWLLPGIFIFNSYDQRNNYSFTKHSLHYFPTILSKLILPGPVKSKTKKTIRNNPAASPLPKKSALWAENKATDIAMMSGTHANRVNSPMMIKAAQKNSAKTTSASEVVGPMWKGSANFGARDAKWVSLSKPCFTNIKVPTPNLKTNKAKPKAFSETLVLNSLFIQIMNFGASLLKQLEA